MLKLTNFIGREIEKQKIRELLNANCPSILIVYGRRRVGKTYLLTNTLPNDQTIKIEGLEGKGTHEQIDHALHQLAVFFKDPLIANLKFSNWVEFFEFLATKTKTGKWVIYLEEIQWLANYREDIIVALKYVWDNYLQKNNNLLLVLCGSSPSFAITKIIRSKALYNRSFNIMHLKEFPISEAKLFFSKYFTEIAIFDAYLSVGGIPEYLKFLKNESSYLTLLKNSFSSDSFFFTEYERIFTSSLGTSSIYKEIVEVIAKNKYLNRQEISSRLKINSGGRLSGLLENLELSGFIERQLPFYKTSKENLARYYIKDPYLNFYYKFISPKKAKIKKNLYAKNLPKAMLATYYQQYLAYSFERWCYENHPTISEILGFSAVDYEFGPLYINGKKSNLKEEHTPSSQIDLVFSRADGILTICEIKYTNTAVKKSIISEFEEKLAILEQIKIKKHKGIQRVLISALGAEKSLESAGYFDRFITVADLLR